MISIGRFLGHHEKFYDLLEASAKQADTSVPSLVGLLARIERCPRAAVRAPDS
jgi:hypothetical protein